MKLAVTGTPRKPHHPDQPAWSQPLVVYVRRAGDVWPLVGLERNP